MLAWPLPKFAHGGPAARRGRFVGDDHAALHRGDDLVRVEAEAADVAGGAHAPAAVARARRLARVLDEGEAAPARQRDDGIMSAGCPNRCTGRIARVRAERRLQRRGRHVVGLGVDLANTGRAPAITIAFAEAMHDSGVVTTSSPARTPRATSATCSAAVPVLVATAAAVPQSRANPASSSRTRAPCVTRRLHHRRTASCSPARDRAAATAHATHASSSASMRARPRARRRRA